MHAVIVAVCCSSLHPDQCAFLHCASQCSVAAFVIICNAADVAGVSLTLHCALLLLLHS